MPATTLPNNIPNTKLDSLHSIRKQHLHRLTIMSKYIYLLETNLWGVVYTMLILLLSCTRIGSSDGLLPVARLFLPLDTSYYEIINICRLITLFYFTKTHKTTYQCDSVWYILKLIRLRLALSHVVQYRSLLTNVNGVTTLPVT